MNENLTYHREGDYLLPNVIQPENPHIGIWGLRRKNYLLKNKKPIYTGMLLSGKLNAHLKEIDRTTNEMLDQLVGEMAKREGITKALRESNQMAWLGAMNNIRNRAEEIVLRAVVYA